MLLVTGAAGHLGNVFIRHLLERGEQGEQGIRAMILPGEDRSPGWTWTSWRPTSPGQRWGRDAGRASGLAGQHRGRAG